MKSKKFEKFSPIEIPGTHCTVQLAEVSTTDSRGTTTRPAACITITDDEGEISLSESFNVKELNTLVATLQSLLHQMQHTAE